MKLNFNICFIVFLFLVIVLCCLANISYEGMTNNNNNNNFSQDHQDFMNSFQTSFHSTFMPALDRTLQQNNNNNNNKNNNNNDNNVDQNTNYIRDVDEYGCIRNAGYSWCPSKSRCIRLSQESCPISNQVPGISRSQIPYGEEDQYILKSEIVPPVCPACPPPVVSCNKCKKIPPCPPCARCPEPAYKCNLVPDYSTDNRNVIPAPILDSPTNNNSNVDESALYNLDNNNNNNASDALDALDNTDGLGSTGELGGDNYGINKTNIPKPVLNNFSTF